MEERDQQPDTGGGVSGIGTPDHFAEGTNPVSREIEFDNFYRTYTPKIVAFLMYQGASLHDAAEITQESMTKLYANLDKVNFKSAWLRKVAARELIRRWVDKEDSVADVPEPTALIHEDVDIAAWELKQDAISLLSKLPLRQRQVMAWTIAGFAPVEIAELLEMEPTAVRGSLKKARRTIIEIKREEEGK